MPLFKKTDAPAPPSKMVRRIRALPTHDLIPWGETCLYEAGRALSEYRKSGDPAYMADAELASQTLSLIVAEVRGRQAAEAYVEPVEPFGLS